LPLGIGRVGFGACSDGLDERLVRRAPSPPIRVPADRVLHTLTSTGLGDVIPVRPQARALMMTEMVAGIMYVALVVSRLVGLTLPRRA
jgi:hypothetical protein